MTEASNQRAAPPADAAAPMWERLLRRFALVEPGELGPMLWSTGYLFFVFFSYTILKPIRESVGAGFNRDQKVLESLFTATMVVMLLVSPLFAWLVSRVPRRRFIPFTYHFFAANLLVFFALMKYAPPDWQRWISYSFFVWVSVFNLFANSLFWGFMSDVFRRDQGTRLFGFVAIGATIGSIFGSGLVKALVERVGQLNLLPVSAVVLEVAVVCFSVIVYRFGLGRGTSTPTPASGEHDGAGKSATGDVGGSVFSGFTLLVRSPYLLGICLYLLLYTTTSTYLYFEQAKIAKEQFPVPEQRTEFLASITLWSNLLTLAVQVFATGRIARRLGVSATLAFLPALTAVGIAVLGFSPTALTLLLVQVARSGLHYGVDRPSREMLYTVLGREEKYKSKSFIDTFVYRGGDQIGTWLRAPLEKIHLAVLIGFFIGLTIVWGITGVWLGRRQRSIAQAQEAARPAASTPASPPTAQGH